MWDNVQIEITRAIDKMLEAPEDDNEGAASPPPAARAFLSGGTVGAVLRASSPAVPAGQRLSAAQGRSPCIGSPPPSPPDAATPSSDQPGTDEVVVEIADDFIRQQLIRQELKNARADLHDHNAVAESASSSEVPSPDSPRRQYS